MKGDDGKPAPREAAPAEWEKLAAPLRRLAQENPDAFADALRALIGRKPGKP